MQCVVEQNWVLEADRVQKILKHDLRHYKTLIDNKNYAIFEKSLKVNRNTTAWYSKKMTQDALCYILASSSIREARENVTRRFEDSKNTATPMTEAEKEREFEHAVLASKQEWVSKVPKLVIICNPEFGDFLKKCEEMHAFCEREKDGGEGRVPVQCGLDRARLFTSVTLDAEFRCTLLQAHINPILRKKFYHPVGNFDHETKSWLNTWGMWSTLEKMCFAILHQVLLEIKPLMPEGRVPEGVKYEDLISDIHYDFHKYANTVRTTYFSQLWHADRSNADQQL